MTVIPFHRPEKKQPGGHDELEYTVYIYKDAVNNSTTAYIEQPKVETVDMDAFLDRLMQVVWNTHTDRFERTNSVNDDLLLVTRVFRSSLVSTSWGIQSADEDNGFETPRQLRWLRDRLTDVYWQVDERHGLRYRLHRMHRAIQLWWRRNVEDGVIPAIVNRLKGDHE